MNTRKLAVSAQVRVHLDNCQGDLVLRGGDEPELKIQSQEALAEGIVQQSGDTVHLSELPKCRLFVPRQAVVVIGQVAGDLRADGLASLEVDHVGGDLRVKGGTIHARQVQGDFTANELAGNVTLDAASGDVSLREVTGDAVIHLAGGDLRVRQIGGALRVDEVQENVSARNLTGVLELGHVGGDVVLVNLRGGVETQQVDGEVVLKSELASGTRYNIQARGDVVLKLPLQTSARLVLEAPSGEITSTVPLDIEEEIVGRLVGTLGGADKRADVFLHTTGGSITLRPLTVFEDRTAEQASLGFDPETIAELVQTHVAASLGTSDVDEFVRREAERALQRAERARAKAERAAERAQRHIERQAEKAAKRWRVSWRGKRSVPRRAAEPVTEAEHLAVLKMLEEGKITAEEASKLLEALES